jgi:hypothetical protein
LGLASCAANSRVVKLYRSVGRTAIIVMLRMGLYFSPQCGLEEARVVMLNYDLYCKESVVLDQRGHCALVTCCISSSSCSAELF